VVKVISLDIFDYHGVVPLEVEPMAVTCANGATEGEALIVAATVDGLITAYDGKTNPVHCFRSRGPVHLMRYSEARDALVTLETLAEDDCTLLFVVWTFSFPRGRYSVRTHCCVVLCQHTHTQTSNIR
jgi:hypothetical protein